MGPGRGVETAAARLAALSEDGRVERQQGELEIPGTPTARCRVSVECREKVVKPEPSEEVRLEENSGWRHRRGGTVVGLAVGLKGSAAMWPAQRAANAAT